MGDALVDEPQQPKIPKSIIGVLIKVQKDLKPLAKTSDNDSYGSKFTPLPEVMTAALGLLNDYDVMVTQSPTLTAEGQSAFSTTLAHKDGSTYTQVTKLAIEKINPQSHASAITYMRRYQLMAMIGLTSEDDDDDGNKAAGVFAKVSEEQLDHIRNLLKQLKWPTNNIAFELRNIHSRDAADLAIINYEKKASEKMRDREAEEAAIEAEKHTTHIDVTDEDAHEPTIKEKLANVCRRHGLIPKVVVLGITKKPFLKNCDEADLKELSKTLDVIDNGERELPDDWYLAGHPPIKVAAEDAS
jgi:hypothetical protein